MRSRCVPRRRRVAAAESPAQGVRRGRGVWWLSGWLADPALTCASQGGNFLGSEPVGMEKHMFTATATTRHDLRAGWPEDPDLRKSGGNFS